MREIGRGTWVENIGRECAEDHDRGGNLETEKSRKATVHQMRERRACFDELVQIDGSPHDWFEGRAAKCSLLVFINDATGRLGQLLFDEQ